MWYAFVKGATKVSLALLAIILVIVLAIVAKPVTEMIKDSSNPLRKPAAEIRESILELTPMGTDMADVIRLVESNEEWKTLYVNYKRGVPYNSITLPEGYDKKGETTKGEKSICVYMGNYRTGIIMSFGVSAFWAFDADSKLIEVFVSKSGIGF